MYVKFTVKYELIYAPYSSWFYVVKRALFPRPVKFILDVKCPMFLQVIKINV